MESSIAVQKPSMSRGASKTIGQKLVFDLEKLNCLMFVKPPLMTKLPPLRALQALEAFGRLGSVTDAAKELGVSAGAVSQQLRKVEEAIGVSLLQRHGRGIDLTARGVRYHLDLAAGFGLLRKAQASIDMEKLQSSLTISCLPSLASKWLGSLLFDWQSKHPQASIRLIGEDREPHFGEEAVDFRICYGDKVDAFEHFSELFTDWVVATCSPAFLAKHPVNVLADILEYPLLGIEWARDQRIAPSWAEWAASIGCSYHPAKGDVAFSLSSAAIDAAINGRGFVLAQLSMAADDIASGRLVVPVGHRIRLPESYFLAWDRAALEKPFGQQLRAWITATARQLEALNASS
jgi:LysR family transcriptional regulator, glycine cleavage system transcriptional activator